MSYNFEERYNEIRKKLIAQGYANKRITYKEFLSLYESYKEEMSEKEFASILGISYGNLQNIKYKNTKAVILKEYKTDKERKKLEQEIVSDLMEKGYQNKKIDYAEFLKLYEPYRTKAKESEFASFLGISYANWQNIKQGISKSIINFEHKYFSRILFLFRENKEYDLEYFEKVSKDFELPISKILEILTKGKINSQELINALYTRGKIFVGQTKISDSFLQKYVEIISNVIHKYSKFIGERLHTSLYAEDIAQETILWVINNKGSIEKNFEEKIALKRIIIYAKTYCKYMHFEAFGQKKVVSLDEVVSKDGKLTRLIRVKSKENVQNSVEKREEEIEISEEDTPITVIQQCLLNGMNREESLSFVMEKFNIIQKELLEMLTEELSKKNKLKVAETGEIYLGARDE